MAAMGTDIQDNNFNPLSPCGERPLQPFHANEHLKISTHSLRVERDFYTYNFKAPFCNFNPLSPCGERHIPFFGFDCHEVISTHSLRVERDEPQAQG